MKKKQKSITTVVSFILDESGSMQSIKDSVITGFNEYVQGLKSQKGKILFSLTKFDTTAINTVDYMKSIEEVSPLTPATYRPNAGTPLYDAVVQTVEKLAEDVKDNQAVIVAIMTDGEENSSQKHNQKCLRELIQKLEVKGNWTFVFMGANQDSWALAQTIGISRGNTMDWQATERGTSNAFMAMASSTMDLNNALVKDPSVLRSVNFFNTASDNEKKKTEEVKQK